MRAEIVFFALFSIKIKNGGEKYEPLHSSIW